ncbi:uncharacterized protein LOC121422171 [Lytechinus variegatus]|uniref:uncharacterized protein LOC121422171 n=1 Tax=Lytechinus variegatus TaxID=7654 RepID=UPI001BB256C5|nr:uncharacterized protein LOC121422171 [Lytechinus variegatus]XP_041473004.1 uncharacterized protein LOC121422171 [Lytechinus variegatus]
MMKATSVFTGVLFLLGSCYSINSLSLDIGDVEFQQVTVNAGESATLECQAGTANNDDVYWLSVRYRRFISKNDILFDYGTDWDNFGISVDTVDSLNRIYYLDVYMASEDVSGIYMCYSSIGLDKLVLWAGEVIVIPGNDFPSSLDTSVFDPSKIPNPSHSLQCSATYIPPMMNLINVNEEEMEVRCSWSAQDHPDARPMLFCNGKELLSKYFVGEIVTARVMLNNIEECFNFTCALKGMIGESPFEETCSYMQNERSGLLAQVRRQGVRIDPLYSVIQQGMDAMFVCISSSEAPNGTFHWNVSSRLYDPGDLISNMEVTQSNKASMLMIKDIQILTDEPLIVSCQLISEDQTESILISEALLTIMSQLSDYSHKRSTNIFDETFGMTIVLPLIVSVSVLFVIAVCFLIFICKTRKRNNEAVTPKEGANNNENRKMPVYVSMKNIMSRNITKRPKHPSPAEKGASGPDIQVRKSPALVPRVNHPAQGKTRSNIKESQSTDSLGVKLPICISDDGDYLLPDGAQGVDDDSQIVLRAKNSRHPRAHYPPTEVLVGSKKMMSARSWQEDQVDKSGYLVPSMVVDDDIGVYVYATSDVMGGNLKPPRRKTSSCHELSNYSYASY